MAKIQIAGNVASITMGVDASIVNKVAKYTPEAMKLTDENGDTNFILTVGQADSFNQYGATFATASNTTGKYSAAIRIPNDVADAKKYCAEHYGAMISKLNDVEAQITESAVEAEEIQNKIDSAIQVVE